MRKGEMQQLQGKGECHTCAPKDWRGVPNLSGDYDLDATIMHRDNASLPSRLNQHLRRGGSYGPGTGYNAYSGYSKDN